MLAINIISTLKKVPSLSGMPDNVIMAIVAAAAVMAALLLFIAAYFIFDYTQGEQEENKSPDSHKLIMDLQKNLIDEMKGTSQQNKLMINLTIVFILITVIGIIVGIMGPERTMNAIGPSVSKAFGSLGKVFGR
jgi:hypothetical protein